MRNKIIYSLLLLLVWGCAINPIRYAPKNFSKSDNTGLITGTISFVDNKRNYPFSRYDILYRKKEGKNKYKISIESDRIIELELKPDYIIGDTLVFQYIMECETGSYEFFNYGIYMPFGNLHIPTYKESKDFSLPFEVNKGEILYLGDIVVDVKKFIKSGNLINWVDNSSRELSKFEEKFPKIDWELFRNNTIREGKIENKKLIKFGK